MACFQAKLVSIWIPKCLTESVLCFNFQVTVELFLRWNKKYKLSFANIFANSFANIANILEILFTISQFAKFNWIKIKINWFVNRLFRIVKICKYAQNQNGDSLVPTLDFFYKQLYSIL